jgi:hypothetical protein
MRASALPAADTCCEGALVVYAAGNRAVLGRVIGALCTFRIILPVGASEDEQPVQLLADSLVLLPQDADAELIQRTLCAVEAELAATSS